MIDALQAWGLLELQRGNALAALLLLERSAILDPANVAVLNWAQVSAAGTDLVLGCTPVHDGAMCMLSYV